MPTLIAGVVAVVLLYSLLQMFRAANPVILARAIKISGGVVALAVAAFTGIKGELAVAIPLGIFGAGLSLQPTEVLIFGNAKAGTPLMQSVQTIGIDLPLKALVWQDASGVTWLSYNDPAWLAERHGLGSGTSTVIGNMSAGLAAMTKAATSSA